LHIKHFFVIVCRVSIFSILKNYSNENILDVCRAYAELHGIVFNCSETVCITFKTMSAKSTIIPLPALGGQNVKSVNRYKYWGLCSTLSSLIDIQRQLQYQYCAPNKLRASFSCCSNAVKMHFFVPSVCPYMHHKYGVISGRQACRDCVWLIILGAGLYATCRGERVLVITRFNANSYL